MAEEKETKWVLCTACGQRRRRHRVLYEKRILIANEEDQPPEQQEHHRLVECMGCETINMPSAYLIGRQITVNGAI